MLSPQYAASTITIAPSASTSLVGVIAEMRHVWWIAAPPASTMTWSQGRKTPSEQPNAAEPSAKQYISPDVRRDLPVLKWFAASGPQLALGDREPAVVPSVTSDLEAGNVFQQERAQQASRNNSQPRGTWNGGFRTAAAGGDSAYRSNNPQHLAQSERATCMGTLVQDWPRPSSRYAPLAAAITESQAPGAAENLAGISKSADTAMPEQHVLLSSALWRANAAGVGNGVAAAGVLAAGGGGGGEGRFRNMVGFTLRYFTLRYFSTS